MKKNYYLFACKMPPNMLRIGIDVIILTISLITVGNFFQFFFLRYVCFQAANPCLCAVIGVLDNEEMRPCSANIFVKLITYYILVGSTPHHRIICILGVFGDDEGVSNVFSYIGI